MTISVCELDPAALSARIDALAGILVDSVGQGAAIGFMAPLGRERAVRFWTEEVGRPLALGQRHVFAAERGGATVGTVQLLTAMPENQPHRCEIAKMIVHPGARRLGVGRALMGHALARAAALGRTLVTLDTRTGDVAEPLYASVGFVAAGVVPGYAWDADGRARHATTLMYRTLDPPAPHPARR